MKCRYLASILSTKDKLFCEIFYDSEIPFLPHVGMEIYLPGNCGDAVESVSWDERCSPSLEIYLGEWLFEDIKTMNEEIEAALEGGWEKLTYLKGKL